MYTNAIVSIFLLSFFGNLFYLTHFSKIQNHSNTYLNFRVFFIPWDHIIPFLKSMKYLIQRKKVPKKLKNCLLIVIWSMKISEKNKNSESNLYAKFWNNTLQYTHTNYLKSIMQHLCLFLLHVWHTLLLAYNSKQ